MMGLAPLHAETPPSSRLSIAAASNLVFALDALTAAFTQTHPEIQIRVSTAASGTLVAQIRHGAPFDVFLSADLDYPQALIAAGNARAESLVTFAHGVLCLWPVSSATTAADLPTLLTSAPRPRLAIANPDTAPFGRAARTILQDLQLWATLEPRIILGENVAQTFQFVRSGNADLGFVPLSLLQAHPSSSPHLLLPATSRELAHGAVLLNHGATNAAANAFLTWLQSEPAQALLRDHGYLTPTEVTLDAGP